MKKFLFDLFPVIVFFIAYKLGNTDLATSQHLVQSYLGFMIVDGKVPDSVAPTLLATFVAIVATFGQLAYLFTTKQKIDGMLWLSFVIIVVFGGMTIYFHSEEFIKWKPTILYWCFGIGLITSQYVFKRNPIRALLQAQAEIQLPDGVWARLGLAWGMFFFVMGLINLYVAFYANASTNTWVNFKLFGGPALMFVFIIGQSMYLSKYLDQEK